MNEPRREPGSTMNQKQNQRRGQVYNTIVTLAPKFQNYCSDETSLIMWNKCKASWQEIGKLWIPYYLSCMDLRIASGQTSSRPRFGSFPRCDPTLHFLDLHCRIMLLCLLSLFAHHRLRRLCCRHLGLGVLLAGDWSSLLLLGQMMPCIHEWPKKGARVDNEQKAEPRQRSSV